LHSRLISAVHFTQLSKVNILPSFNLNGLRFSTKGTAVLFTSLSAY
jgi:hypothetical protein